VWEDSVIIFGGSSSASTKVQKYNFTSGQWINLAQMENAHFFFGCVILPQNKTQVEK
jgi:hypothetical protein